MDIRNKAVLITGGASGLGFTYAQKLLQNGAKVVALLDLATSPGQSSVVSLEKDFGKGKAVFFPCDVANAKQFAEAFKKAVSAVNGVDIVINNAGMFNDLKWQETVNVNITGVIQGSLLALEHMSKLKGGNGGVIVNIASIVALELFPMCPVYCSSKHSVLAFSRCLAHYYNRTGVSVLTMCPGVTSTALLVNASKSVFDFVTDKEVQQLGKLKPQEPEVVGDAMVLLIQKGQSGAVWVSEEEKPPHFVEFPPVQKVEVPQ